MNCWRMFAIAALVGFTFAARADVARMPGQSFQECEQCPTMVVVPPARFVMGAAPRDADRNAWEEPQHTVTLPRAFAVGVYSVTRKEYAAFVAEVGEAADKLCTVWQGTKFTKDPTRDWREPGFAQTETDPVVCVSWQEAKRYVAWLNAKIQRGNDGPYRLLSEAEWEYAARASSTAIYWWGDGIGVNNANCDGCGSIWDNQSTSPVGSFAANAFGLYDVTGNAWQWTEDCDHDSFNGAPNDGSAWMTGACGKHMVRGGSWFKFPKNNRISYRFWDATNFRSFILGFRVARTLD